jgi:hypothetical protein
MSYRVNRAEGFQPWGVTNPFVFADLSQPQRQRGRVSPLVYTTQPPYLRSSHLGPANRYLPSSQLGQIPPPGGTPEAAEARGARMERYALAGVIFGAISLYLTWKAGKRRGMSMSTNRRRRRSRR